MLLMREIHNETTMRYSTRITEMDSHTLLMEVKLVQSFWKFVGQYSLKLNIGLFSELHAYIYFWQIQKTPTRMFLAVLFIIPQF